MDGLSASMQHGYVVAVGTHVVALFSMHLAERLGGAGQDGVLRVQCSLYRYGMGPGLVQLSLRFPRLMQRMSRASKHTNVGCAALPRIRSALDLSPFLACIYTRV